MSVDEETKELIEKIKVAREYAKSVFDGREKIVGMFGGSLISGYELEFSVDEPDVMYVYTILFGQRCGEPTVYRLAFKPKLKWIGVSHPWGFKPSDIEVIQ